MKYTDHFEGTIKGYCLRKKSSVRTSAELDERIVDDALTAQRKSKTRQSAAMPVMWRIMMRTRMTKYVTGAVIAVAIVIWIVGIRPVGRANAVFAAAMESVRVARTFSCVTAFKAAYEHGGDDGQYTLRQKTMFKEPDRERREQLTSAPPWPEDVGKVTIWHYDKRQRLEYRPFDKTAKFHDMASDYMIDEKTGELKLTQLDTRLRDHLLEVSAGAVEDLGAGELDGQSVRILRSKKDNRVTTIWVNPKNKYPVQIEYEWTDESRSPVMFASIRIDAELDDDLFSLDPPEGYALTTDGSPWPDDRAKMMTKAKYLGLWCVIYANDNDDQFPNDLGDLVKAGAVTEEVLNRAAASPNDPDGPPVFRCRTLNADAKDWANQVILYEMYDRWPEDGIAACFADGHCELIVDQKRFEELTE